jgi:hypothetical protein
MRINEVVGKVDTGPDDTMDKAYQATKNLFSPSTWFKGKEKPVDPNLVQNGLNDVLTLLIKGQKLLPADVNNLKTISAQVQNGSMKPGANINAQVLQSALAAGLRNQELNPQQQRAVIDFRKQFH